MSDPVLQGAIAQAVLAYLDRSPLAADDVRGIATRWLPEMGVDAPQEEVAHVLAELSARGHLAAHPSLVGPTVYSKR